MSFRAEAQQPFDTFLHTRRNELRLSRSPMGAMPSTRRTIFHRYASVRIREGVPVTDLAAQPGHAQKSMTLDTYSHVLTAD